MLPLLGVCAFCLAYSFYLFSILPLFTQPLREKSMYFECILSIKRAMQPFCLSLILCLILERMICPCLLSSRRQTISPLWYAKLATKNGKASLSSMPKALTLTHISQRFSIIWLPCKR